jgi:hypothetical protein
MRENKKTLTSLFKDSRGRTKIKTMRTMERTYACVDGGSADDVHTGDGKLRLLGVVQQVDERRACDDSGLNRGGQAHLQRHAASEPSPHGREAVHLREEGDERQQSVDHLAVRETRTTTDINTQVRSQEVMRVNRARRSQCGGRRAEKAQATHLAIRSRKDMKVQKAKKTRKSRLTPENLSGLLEWEKSAKGAKTLQERLRMLWL